MAFTRNRKLQQSYIGFTVRKSCSMFVLVQFSCKQYYSAAGSYENLWGGGGSSSVVGIICPPPPGCDRVN